MACLLALTLLAVLAAGAASLRSRACRILTAVSRFLDHFGHNSHALTQAEECPPL